MKNLFPLPTVSATTMGSLSSPHLDELVREFLLFRGFAQSIKAFDAETKAEKEKGFRVDR